MDTPAIYSLAGRNPGLNTIVYPLRQGRGSPAKVLFRKSLLPVGYNGHGRGKDMEQFAVRDVDEKDEAGYYMEIPQEVRIDFYISEKLREKISPE
jgi:hypothetical protein